MAKAKKLSAQRLLNKVASTLKLDDFGDPRFVAEYTHAMETIDDELNLSPTGVAITEEFAERSLTNLLRMQRDLKAHPEIHDEVLAPPIVVTGFARSGTTKMQRLLSVNPYAQKLALWKLLNHAPFDGAPLNQLRGLDPRIAWAEAVIQASQQAAPEMWAAHPTPPLDAEEDFLLHDLTMISPTVGMRVGARHYMNACTPMNPRVYEFLRTALKYLQWQSGDPGRATKPWILKSPIHIGNLVLLQKIFPGAKIVHCHRDAETSLASTASLDELSRKMYEDHLDLTSIGTGAMEYWGREWQRNLETRSQLAPGSFCDIRFEDVNKNALAVAEKVCVFAGLTFDDAARNAIAQWEAANPRHKAGTHVYNGADYGLTRERVRKAYAAYYDYFAGSDILK